MDVTTQEVRTRAGKHRRAVSPAKRAKLDEILARYCQALGHPARVRIVRLLVEEDCIFGNLASRMNLAQSTVSQHLSVLKRVGLVQAEADGKRMVYCIDRDKLQEISDLLNSM